MQKKRRIPLKYLKNLSSKELEPKERGLVNSIIKAQRDYPQITPRMYKAFWITYERYFVLEGDKDAP